MRNNDLKVSLFVTPIGLLAGALIGLHQVSAMTEEMRQLAIAQLGSTGVLVALGAVQSGILTVISTFFGLKLARKVNLEINLKFDKDSVILATVLSILTALILSLSDKFIFASYLPPQAGDYQFSLLYFVASVLYGGIIEELMLRLFLMSLFVFILWRLFARSKDEGSIPSWIYVGAIVLAAILFAAGHLPATAQMIELTTPIVIRAFLLNGVGGIIFGYLFWKKGLAYSIYAHMMTHVVNQLVVMPIFF